MSHVAIVITLELAKQCIQDPVNNLLQVHTMKQLGQGFDNVVFLVNETIVFRFPKHAEAESLMNDENRVLPALQNRLSLDIPKLLYFGKPVQKYPFHFHGYEIVSGVSAYKIDLSDQELRQCLQDFAHFLVQLHGVSAAQAHLMGAQKQLYDKTTVRHVIESLENRIKILWENGIIARDELFIQAWIEQSKKVEIVHDHDCLVHGDLDFRHLIIQNKKLSGIIDWGDVGINHPVIDFVVVHQMFPQSMHELFFQIYGNVAQDIWLYARFLALHRSVTLMLYGYDMRDAQLLEAAKKSYERLTNHI